MIPAVHMYFFCHNRKAALTNRKEQSTKGISNFQITGSIVPVRSQCLQNNRISHFTVQCAQCALLVHYGEEEIIIIIVISKDRASTTEFL